MDDDSQNGEVPAEFTSAAPNEEGTRSRQPTTEPSPSLDPANLFGRQEEQRKKVGPCCKLDGALHAHPPSAFLPLLTSSDADSNNPIITIVEARKSTDHSSTPYITYHIVTNFPGGLPRYQANHRYSEFEGFRKFLTKLHPTSVVPPIPAKHSVADYATKPNKAKEDPHIIEVRKRMLQSFLNRVAAHPVLREEHVFHRFLEGEAPWSEILGASGLSHYLKKKDTAVKVSDKGHLRRPDPHFTAAEDYTARFASQVSHSHAVHRSMLKTEIDMSATYADLGAAYNGWSLSENQLAHAIEQVGQAVDSTVSATSQLAQGLDATFGALLQEYIQYSKAVDKLLKWRRKKHVEYETLSDSLISKQASLQKLEASEAEAQRLSAVLRAEGATGHVRRNSTGGGIMATLNSLIDNDPALTRRNNISRTKDQIATIAQQREICRAELEGANEEIQKDLDRFQLDKLKDLRNMLLGYAQAQREFFHRGARAWQEAKAEVDKVSH
ncbi:uncharacterized protein EV422DRAFT_538792 [Fimicolochytrium jonesii]|uniref:uncharacterized protein n=1 Tax=Fimicolochytrium jonesii TaxID=1396493 RepID=UPI0022FEFD90|nr:uncharacterized protein EV422DRAFT_538792 [Fimicolochytrium jonesii]KAI8818114.1 hypothetical protein EV422DRAFT_538792 [Fimicolochytrium jonesii]